MSVHTGGMTPPIFSMLPAQAGLPDPSRSGWFWIPNTTDGLNHCFAQASDLQVYNNQVLNGPNVLPPPNVVDANGIPVFFGPDPQPLPQQLPLQPPGLPNQN